VQTTPAAPDMDNFSLKANSITREVVAVMEIEDGAVLEMVIKLPTSSPLRRAEVTCRRRVSLNLLVVDISLWHVRIPKLCTPADPVLALFGRVCNGADRQVFAAKLGCAS